jgi:FkbM family methyltransferase
MPRITASQNVRPGPLSSWMTANQVFKQRCPVLHKCLKRVSTLRLPGLRGICLPRRIAGHLVWTHPRMLATEPPEAHILRWVSWLLPRGGTFFDVGAHYGWISIAAARRAGRSGRVVAFEPSPVLADILSYHKRVNRLTQIEIVAKAVSNIDSEAVPFFLVNKGLSFRNSLTIGADDTPYIRPEDKTRREVASTTLDRFCEASQVIPDLIKIDVEGAELFVLQGALELLARYHPALIVGVHSYWLPRSQSVAQILDVLNDYGYEVKDQHAVNFEGAVAADYLCIPQLSSLRQDAEEAAVGAS